MSRIRKSSEVSDSGSDSSSQTRGHHYNTRYSAKNSNTSQVYSRRKGDRCGPSFRRDRKSRRRDEDLINETPVMDYCYDSSLERPRRSGICCRIVTTLFYALFLSGVLYLVWSLYIMRTELDKFKDELVNIKGGNKKEDPYEKLFKDLNKKCVDAIKLLLQDPVGRADFALESSGGRIISVDAGSYTARSKLLGFTLCEGSHTASAMIRATSSPGECWAFKGQTGSAIIQLIGHVLIDSVTLEHISAKLSPTGTIDSAPKNFKIWGLAQPNRKNRAILGEFTYENDGTTLQTFKVNNTNYYKYIEFEVLSNHGNKEYTCVYRVYTLEVCCDAECSVASLKRCQTRRAANGCLEGMKGVFSSVRPAPINNRSECMGR